MFSNIKVYVVAVRTVEIVDPEPDNRIVETIKGQNVVSICCQTFKQLQYSYGGK